MHIIFWLFYSFNTTAVTEWQNRQWGLGGEDGGRGGGGGGDGM